jgi:hypothetical protein
MREPVTADRLHDFMRRLSRAARTPARVYLTGGATAVLEGWRTATLDVDLKLVPDSDALLRAIPELKEVLRLNVELAAPDDFIPVLPGWEDRSRFIAREGLLSFHHFDFTAQALAKIERGHDLDIIDVRTMLERGLIDTPRLRSTFERIEPDLYRYPAISAAAFRRAVEAIVDSASDAGDEPRPRDAR